MATGDSVIRVSIIGDAAKLNKAVASADKSTQKLGSSMKKIGLAIGALGAVKVGFDFAQDALAISDQAGDAITTLDRIIGKVNAQKLDDVSEGFTKIGLSSSDFLTFSATFAAFARGAGVGVKSITGLAPGIVAVAQALSFADPKGRDTAAMLDLIDKAASGLPKPLKELGIKLNEATIKQEAMRHFGVKNEKQLTKGMLATTRYQAILKLLHPEVDKVANSTNDLEVNQARLDARVENLQRKLGDQLAPALATVLGFITDQIDAIPSAIAGWSQLGAIVEGFARDVLGPLGNVADVMRDILGFAGDVGRNVAGFINSLGREPTASERAVVRELSNHQLRNGMGSP